MTAAAPRRRRAPMKSFAERNPVVIAVVGLVVLLVIGFGIFNSRNLPVVGDGPTYAADFTEAAGLRDGDDVTVAGVSVGSVSAVELEGDHVRVEFRVKDAWLGDQSTAAIRIQTLLGAKYLAITPAGTNALKTSDTIPLDRTDAPFDVTDAFEQLSTTVTQIDTDQLGKSFEALSQAFADTPDTVRATLSGLTDLSRSISSRDLELRKLLSNTRTVTATVVDSNSQIQALIKDGDLLLAELQARSDAVTALFQGTVRLAQQLSGLVADNQAKLGPALASLSTVTDVLQTNQANLQKALQLLGPYYSQLNDAVGNGRWLDTYICGLFGAAGPVTVPGGTEQVPTPILDPTAQRDCAPQPGGGS
jgi:phospholipid/cholesterol/gamma-HCH transport system substrate-binding protein